MGERGRGAGKGGGGMRSGGRGEERTTGKVVGRAEPFGWPLSGSGKKSRNMPATYCVLRDSYRDFHKTELTKKFLQGCMERSIIPDGLKLKFHLCSSIDTLSLFQYKQILDNASSRMLDCLLDSTVQKSNKLKNQLETVVMESEKQHGKCETYGLMEKVKKETKHFLTSLQMKLDNKIYKCVQKKSVYDRKVESGFQKTGNVPILSSSYTTLNFPHYQKQTRPHRRKRHRARKNRNSKIQSTKFQPSESDLKQFDPIVLADNVNLTKEQISICRLPDCFAPTPKTPIDVSDQVVGTHAWAERLRWHRYHYLKNKDSDLDSGDDDHFEKMPWYVPTSRSAPKGDPALETFINACTNQFLEVGNRKKIKDNLTQGQRKALKELKQLPLTHSAACRFADKSGVTVITSLKEDDEKVKTALNDPHYYSVVPNNPNTGAILKVNEWSKKWEKNDDIPKDMKNFANDIEKSHPGKCKPLIKTHKSKPFPMRLLLSGCGTPVEPLSKIVQVAIRHLTDFLPYQIIDTKEFLKKIKIINEEFSPLPDSATIAVCDVVSLYPNVSNEMGIPATRKLLTDHPSPIKIPRECIMEALDISLNNNYTQYQDSEGNIIYAKPIRGTAMGPSHACDYVDIFMGELDQILVNNSPVPLLTSLDPNNVSKDRKKLNWSRFRDDGITILPNKTDIDLFTKHLKNLYPPNIKWTVNHGTNAEYLDVKLEIKEGTIATDIFSKHNHSYLPPTSCHSPSVFKGLIPSVGTRLRMICSDDTVLRMRIEEYAKYFALSGWDIKRAKKELEQGAAKERNKLLNEKRKKKGKKLAWVTTYDPRVPSKSQIIKQNLHLLYSDTQNRNIFPRGIIISADRRRQNLGEIYKPSVPNPFPEHGPLPKPGFYICSATRCDTCNHSNNVTSFKSPWDGRKWSIRQALTCTTPNVIYIIRCSIHPEELYIGSCKDLKKRWRNHKSDIKLKKTKKCTVAQHIVRKHQPADDSHSSLEIFAIESVKDPNRLLEKEIWWQCNVGTLFTGLNTRKDLNTMIQFKTRRLFQHKL